MFYKQMKNDLLKRKNSKLVAILDAVWSRQAMNRRDICSFLNLSKGTITKRVNYLLEKGYIVESGSHANTGMGRNPEKLKLDSNLFYSIGLNLSADETNIIILNANNEPVKEIVTNIPESTDYNVILEKILTMIKQSLSDLSIPKEKLLGIGIALPGIVDWGKGIVYNSASLPGAENLQLKKFFTEALNCECEMLNICHLTAINEKNWGKAKNVSDFFCVEDGLGLGIFINNQLCRGWQGYAGEFGYMQIKETGDITSDGRKGTIWPNAAAYRINHALRKMRENGGASQIEKYLSPENPDINFDMVIRAASDGDKLCSAMIAENYDWIAKGILNVAYLLNPEVIYLPAWTAKCPECTINIVKQCLTHYGAANWHLATSVESAKCDKNYFSNGIALYLTQCVFDKIKAL